MLLTTEAATTKRLTRARQKIAAARIPYRVPAEGELAERLPAVCGVIHSLYTAGHAPVDGGAAYDVDACAEAVRLAELLHGLLPDQPAPAAVLALLLLTEARRPARLDEHGDIVTLDEQDRGRWDAAAIARGIALLNDSLRRSRRQADAYQLQAAIAAEHARAPATPPPTGPRSSGSTTCSCRSRPATPPPWAGWSRRPRRPVRRPGSPCSPSCRRARAGTRSAPSCWPARDGTPRRPQELTESLAGPATEPERAHRERRREEFLERAGPEPATRSVPTRRDVAGSHR